MDKDFQTSFIPKKPLVEEKISSRRPVSLLNFVVKIIFVFSIIAAVGVYFYKLTIEKRVQEKDTQIVLASERFDANAIAEMKLLDTRIKASEELVRNHIMLSPIFLALEEVTLKSVSYTKFEYKIITEEGVRKIMVLMTGKATSYEALALQSDALVTNKYIKDTIFSNLNLDDKGRVTFDLSFIVLPTFLNYQDTLNREGGAAQEGIAIPVEQQQIESPQETAPLSLTQEEQPSLEGGELSASGDIQ